LFSEDKWEDKINSEDGWLLINEKSSRPLDETNNHDKALLQILLKDRSVNIDNNYFYYFHGQNNISSICASAHDIMHKIIFNTRKLYYRLRYNGELCYLFNNKGMLIGEVATFCMSRSRRTMRYTKHIFFGFGANLTFEDIVKQIEIELRSYPEVIWRVNKDDPRVHDFDMYIQQKKEIDKYAVSRKQKGNNIHYACKRRK
jgi:hypothetical protein